MKLLGGALLALALVAVGVQPAATRPPVRLEQLRVGLTPRQVRELLGPPQRVARQIFYQGYLEQWVYERPLPCRIDFLHRLGKEAQIQSVHPLSNQKR
jgi:hypothetical protein